MTTAHAASPLVVEDLEQALQALRAHGLRASAARRLVLQALLSAEAPVSAEAIAGGLGGRVTGGDLASIYRNLETFEQLGLVQHVHLGHGPALYRLARRKEGAYLLCERCGTVRELAAEELANLRAMLREAHGFVARFGHFPVGGLCGACAASVA